jgi:hypothetical protein
LRILNQEANNAGRFPNRKLSTPKTEEPDFDWKNLRIDTDKQTYYQGMIDRRSRTAPAGIRVSKDSLNSYSLSKPTRTSVAPSLQHKQRDLKSGSKSVKLEISDFPGDTKMMEQALNITKSDKNANSTRSFLKSREKCYEQRFRLTNLLAEDLIRMDDDRRDKFKRKFKALTVDVCIPILTLEFRPFRRRLEKHAFIRSKRAEICKLCNRE